MLIGQDASMIKHHTPLEMKKKFYVMSCFMVEVGFELWIIVFVRCYARES